MGNESNQLSKECKDLFQAHGELCNQALSYLKSLSVSCAIDLGIPDAIFNHGQPMKLSELHLGLSLAPSKMSHLRRLMRLLTHSGFFSELQSHADKEAMYDLTSISRLVIKKEGSSNLAPLFRTLLHDVDAVNTSRQLSDWFKKDSLSPFRLPPEADFWDLKNWKPGFHKLFTEGMACNSSFLMDLITKNCADVFQGIKSMVDVGGGNGSSARSIVGNFPHIKCTVLDVANVVSHLADDNNGAVKFVAGDMFNYIPPADAVFLKWVLHNWSDEECVKILKLCKAAIPSKGGKVVIIDCVIGSNPEMNIKEAQLLTDMLMMIVTKGAEREEQEFAKLFKEAGFSSYKVAYALGCQSIIEIYP